MTFKQKILCFFASLGMLIVLAIGEFYLLKFIDEQAIMEWPVHLAIFVGLIVLVNPFIVMFIINKIPFKIEGLKVEKGLKEALKKETL